MQQQRTGSLTSIAKKAVWHAQSERDGRRKLRKRIWRSTRPNVPQRVPHASVTFEFSVLKCRIERSTSLQKLSTLSAQLRNTVERQSDCESPDAKKKLNAFSLQRAGDQQENDCNANVDKSCEVL